MNVISIGNNKSNESIVGFNYLFMAGDILLATTCNNSMILFLTVSVALSMINWRVC